MSQRLEAMESYMAHQLNVQTERFDAERRRMQHLEDMVHRVGDQLGAILTRAGTRMTAHEVNAAERLERLERLVAQLADSVGEVCDHLGLEANTLNRLQFHPSISESQAHTTWFGSHWPIQNIHAFLDQAAALHDPQSAPPSAGTDDEQVGESTVSEAAPLPVADSSSAPPPATELPHPKIQRIPATPQNSQDTQLTHETLLQSSQPPLLPPDEPAISRPRSRCRSITPSSQPPLLPPDEPAISRPRSRSRSITPIPGPLQMASLGWN